MRCQDTQMSELAELSAMASVVEDVQKRVVAMAEANVVPEEILRDLYETERHLANALRRMNSALRATR